MNRIPMNALALAVSLGFSTGAMAESMSKADYTAAKAGIVGLTRDLAAVLSPQGVHVNCISPGGFALEGMNPEFIKAYSDRTPMRRMGREGSPDLRGAALFLASPASDYVTGHNLVVDGGFTIWQ